MELITIFRLCQRKKRLEWNQIIDYAELSLETIIFNVYRFEIGFTNLFYDSHCLKLLRVTFQII